MKLDWEELDRLRAHPPSALPDDREAQRVLDLYARRLARDAYILRWINALQTTPSLHATEPWHAIGEQRLQVLNIADPTGYRLPPFREMSDVQTRAFLAVRLLSAEPYLWANSIQQLASAAPLPDHVISRSLLHRPFMFWSFETAYPVKPSLLAPDAEFSLHETNWQLHCDESDGVASYSDYLRVPGLDDALRFEGERYAESIIAGSIRYGDRYPQDFNELEVPAVGRTLRLMAFLNSPYVVTSSVVPARAMRRDAERSGAFPLPPEGIRIVQLRERDRTSFRLPAELSSGVNWQHRWWVRAHYRAQWYPSEEAHHVIWIRPHLKGPQDKPVLSHDANVYVVKR